MATKGVYHNISWRPLPYFLALFCTVAIFGIHMLPSMDSMLNENNTQISHVFLKSQIDYHKEIAPFARRPFTTFLIESSSKVFGLKSGYAFIVVNFFLLFLSGLLLYKLSKKLKATKKQALLNMLVYFSSFSILFAFFPPVFTYDEPLQYCFILSALIAFTQKRWVWYVILFTLALVTRETSMLILPAFTLFIVWIRPENETLSVKAHGVWASLVLSPLLFYSFFIGIYIWQNQLLDATQSEMSSRYSCFLENFENNKNTVESLTSIFLSLGPFLYFSCIALNKLHLPLFKKNVINAFLVTVAINTPIVILTAFARESRLFALPLLFIWPMFMQLFGKELKLIFSFRTYALIFKKIPYGFVFLILNGLNYVLCFHIYRNMELGENTYFAEYLFILNFCLISHFLTYFFLIPKVPSEASDI